MQMGRLTRLTSAFGKEWDNLWATYCLHFAHYNFCAFPKHFGSLRRWKQGSPITSGNFPNC